MKTPIILSTRNPGKALQIKDIFAGSPFEIMTLRDAGIEGEADETGDTLEANALLKAEYAYIRSRGMTVMADDSGIFIDALGGAPGVRSARWAGDVSAATIARYTIALLEGKEDRRATFRTTVAVILPTREKRFFTGEVRGSIARKERVPPQSKMPYSGIFIPEGKDKAWAEMSLDEMNALSHRGKAFRQAKDFLVIAFNPSSA